jgi:hypothetical protein
VQADVKGQQRSNSEVKGQRLLDILRTGEKAGVVSSEVKEESRGQITR